MDKKSVETEQNPKTLAEAREKLANLVRESSPAIATALIEAAKDGQVAPAKFLFEVVGLYPATDEAGEGLEKNSLAHLLLERLGLSSEPVTGEEEPVEATKAEAVRGR